VPSCNDLSRDLNPMWDDGEHQAAAGDSLPRHSNPAHPASGDCNGCHSTSPTFTTIRWQQRQTGEPIAATRCACHTRLAAMWFAGLALLPSDLVVKVGEVL